MDYGQDLWNSGGGPADRLNRLLAPRCLYSLDVCSCATPKMAPQILSLSTGSLKNPVLYLLCAIGDNIRAAIPIVREERKRIRVERDAFDTFIERVQAMDTDHQHSAIHPQQMPVQSSSDTDQLQQVRDAYANTGSDW